MNEDGKLTITKGKNCVVNLRKLTHYNPNIDLVKLNVYVKFDQFQSIRLQDIVLSGNEILTITEILTTTKGHNRVVNLRKSTRYNPNLELVNVNAYANLGQIPSIHS